MEKIKNMLHCEKCIKLICGAGNENLKEIEKLAFVFAKAGFNMIDLCAKSEVITAAKKGIQKADKENEISICVSVGLQDDIHLSKAVINRQKCNLCQNCIKECLQEAIFVEDDKIYVDEKKCIGCSNCIKACSNDAIILEHKYKKPYAMLLPLIADGIDCVEFHCSSENIELIYESWNKLKSIYNGIFSICIDRSMLSDNKIIELLKDMVKDESDIIIQADGKPMTGGCDNYKSTLQAVAFGELIRDAEINAFLILSGGTNSKTAKLAWESEVKIDGVALGSFARKLVKPYISDENFWDDEQSQHQAILKAKLLVESLNEYLYLA